MFGDGNRAMHFPEKFTFCKLGLHFVNLPFSGPVRAASIDYMNKYIA